MVFACPPRTGVAAGVAATQHAEHRVRVSAHLRLLRICSSSRVVLARRVSSQRHGTARCLRCLQQVWQRFEAMCQGHSGTRRRLPYKVFYCQPTSATSVLFDPVTVLNEYCTSGVTPESAPGTAPDQNTVLYIMMVPGIHIPSDDFTVVRAD